MADDFILPSDMSPPPDAQASGFSLPSDKAPSGNAFTDIPSEIYGAAKSAVGAIADTLNPFSEARHASYARQAAAPSFMEGMLQNIQQTGDTGKGVLSIPELAMSPITGTARSLLGHPLASTEHAIGTLINPSVAARDNPQEMYDTAKGNVDTAMSAIAPARGGLGAFVNGPTPVPPPPSGPLGVTLSRGQETGDLSSIQFEQSALRGQLGPEAQRQAQAFKDQQDAQVEQAGSNVAKSLDPNSSLVAQTPQDAAGIVSDSVKNISDADKARDLSAQAAIAPPDNLIHPHDVADTVQRFLRGTFDEGQSAQDARLAALAREHDAIRSDLGGGTILANSPQEAADIVSGAVGRAAEIAQERTSDAYDQFRSMPGTFDPQAFRNIGNDIRKSLNLSDDPVVLNSKTTPFGVTAISDLNKTLGSAARSALSGDTKSFPAFSPAYIDNIRKRLVAFQRQAQSSARATGDQSDLRAMRRITDAFDDSIQSAIDQGMFSGDGSAVAGAMSEARALHTDFRRQFTAQGGGDKVGPIIQQIVGRRAGQVAPPNQIAQWLYGEGQIPVMISNRLMQVFGANSPEISAVKQGLFSYLTERPNGVTAWDQSKVADRINNFVNGKGRALSETYLNPQERNRLLQYADDLRRSQSLSPESGDVVGKTIERFVGANGQPSTSAEIADTLLGRNGNVGGNPTGVKLVDHIRQTYGAQSEPFIAIRNGVLSRLMNAEMGRIGFDHLDVSSQIQKFLDGNGRPMANALFNSHEQDVLRQYSNQLKAYAEKTSAPLSDVDRAMERIGGKDGPPADQREIVNMLYGSNGLGRSGLATRLASKLKSEFGNTSAQWSAVKQGLFSRLTETPDGIKDWGPGKIANRIGEFLNGDGKELSNIMFSPQEKTMIQNYANLMRQLEIPQAGANWSNTSSFVTRTMKGVGSTVGTVIGASLARIGLPFLPPLVSEGLGAGVAQGAKKIGEVIEARKIASQMPLVSSTMKRWQKAVDQANKLNSPPSRAALGIATGNLARALEPLGINLESIWHAQGTINSPAQDNHQQ
jgi:hypothetical protein